MKLFIYLFLIFVFNIYYSYTQTVYIHNAFPPPAIKVNVLVDKSNLTKLSPNSWYKWKNDDNKSEVTFKFKVGLFSNSLTLNLKEKSVFYIYVLQHQSGISVFLKELKDAPNEIIDDYRKTEYPKLVQKINEKHPKSEWDEYKLTERFSEKVIEFEGIYEKPFSDKLGPKYKIAVLKEEDGYKIIYLSGGESEFWREGDIKAYLRPTSSSNLYKSIFYDGLT